MKGEVALERAVGLPGLLFLGVGTMVGAGFYALLGKVAGTAGHFTPVSMLAAGGLALVNGLVFAEMASRFPLSAGVARYVREGIAGGWAPRLTGWLVIATGVVSAGTLAVATTGFLQDLVPVERVPCLVVVVIALGVIAAWGIGESVAFIGVITVIEVGALLAVFGLNVEHLNDWRPLESASVSWGEVFGIVSGAFLAFYAFIGFEDMVSVAEETRRPKRTMPLAILLSVAITSLIYFFVSLVAVAGVGPEKLAASRTPVAELVTGLGSAGPLAITVVSVLTGVNGALVQLIMASRVAHGMARQGDAPAWMGQVHEKTRTPVRSTALAAAVVLVLALFFPLETLARSTSAIILVVFAFVSLALWRLKSREEEPPEGVFSLPRWLPLLGLVSCLAALVSELWIRTGGLH